MLLRCYLSTFQTFFFPTVNEPYIGFQPVQLSIEQLRIFYPFQFSKIKYLPPGLCAGVWIWPNTLWQRRRVWKKYSRARQHTQIHSWEYWVERNTAQQSHALEYSDQIHSWEYWEAVIWNQDNVSPLELGRGAVFPFCPSWFLSDSSAVDKWQEGRLMSKFAPPPLYFAAYPIGIKLLQGGLKKRQILGARLPKSANRWE